jgi:hypothetical protein
MNWMEPGYIWHAAKYFRSHFEDMREFSSAMKALHKLGGLSLRSGSQCTWVAMHHVPTAKSRGAQVPAADLMWI